MKRKIGKYPYKHGLRKSRIYTIWINMKQRCLNPKDKGYIHYGGKGIQIYQKWLDNFINFYNWAIETGYNDKLTIERNDNSKNYCPDNCCWIPKIKQAKNKTTTIHLTIFEETKILADWAKDSRCTVTATQLKRRIENGLSPEKALTLPPHTIINNRKIKNDSY